MNFNDDFFLIGVWEKKKTKSNRNLQKVGSFVVKEVFWDNLQEGIVQTNGEIPDADVHMVWLLT